jgi:hypothetical protein
MPEANGKRQSKSFDKRDETFYSFTRKLVSW